MTNTAAQTFRDSLKKILTEYPTPNNIGEGTDFETAHSDHSLYQLVVDQTGNAITELIDTEKYSIKASVGRGSPTFIPYIAVMNKSETTSPQNGRYVVYLFDPIERDLYLTFNQGATEAKEIASDSDLIPAEILRSRAERMAQDIDLQDFTNDLIKFSPQGEKAELYGAGTICYKKYAPENFPEADIILDDLKRLLDEYDQIITSPVPKVINQDTKTTSDTLQDLLDRYLPPDWDDSPSRREQILAVTQYFVEETDPEDSTSARRKEAQKRLPRTKASASIRYRANVDEKHGKTTFRRVMRISVTILIQLLNRLRMSGVQTKIIR